MTRTGRPKMAKGGDKEVAEVFAKTLSSLDAKERAVLRSIGGKIADKLDRDPSFNESLARLVIEIGF